MRLNTQESIEEINFPLSTAGGIIASDRNVIVRCIVSVSADWQTETVTFLCFSRGKAARRCLRKCTRRDSSISFSFVGFLANPAKFFISCFFRLPISYLGRGVSARSRIINFNFIWIFCFHS